MHKTKCTDTYVGMQNLKIFMYPMIMKLKDLPISLFMAGSPCVEGLEGSPCSNFELAMIPVNTDWVSVEF